MKRPLTDKQQSFIEHYCTTAAFNASLAYSMAYPLCKSGQKENGCRLLTKDNIKQAIADKKAEIKAETDYEVVDWLKDVRLARKKAFDAENWPAVATFDRLLAQYTGALELDNRQRQTQLAVAVKNEQVFLDDAIKQARALQGAPDAMVE